MKKIILSIAVVASMSLASYAQSGEVKPEKTSLPVSKEVTSTDEKGQKDQMKSERGQERGQDKKFAHRGGKRGHNQALAKLNLTSDQKTRLAGIKDTYKPQYEALRSDNTVDRETKHNKLKELRTKERAEFETILTADQKATLKSFKDKRFENRKGGKGYAMKRGHGNKDFGKRNMKLDNETLAKLDSLEDQFYAEKQSIKKSRIAPDEQNRRIQELRGKFSADKRELLKEARKANRENKEKNAA